MFTIRNVNDNYYHKISQFVLYTHHTRQTCLQTRTLHSNSYLPTTALYVECLKNCRRHRHRHRLTVTIMTDTIVNVVDQTNDNRFPAGRRVEGDILKSKRPARIVKSVTIIYTRSTRFRRLSRLDPTNPYTATRDRVMCENPHGIPVTNTALRVYSRPYVRQIAKTSSKSRACDGCRFGGSRVGKL